jgi:isopentenyldiphosphate isomerase
MTSELLDVVDQSGRPTGMVVQRDSVHEQGLWHRTVHVWILNAKGEVLFQKRSMDRDSFPGAWDVSSAGHVSAGESPVQAAQKEVLEELGIAVDENELRLLFSVSTSTVQRQGTFVDNEISDVYLVRKDVGIQDLSLQRTEVAGARHFPRGELKRIADTGDPAFAPHEKEYRLLHEYLSRK